MRLIYTLAIPVLLSSCTDMTAVTTISTQLISVSSIWNEVGNEFIASCQRERQVNPALTDCATQQQATDGIVRLNGVLTGYFTALGDAANDSNFTIQPGLGDLASSVENIPGINQAQVSAATGLAGFLAKWALQSLREATVRDLIDKGVPPARELIGALDSLVVKNLTVELNGERQALDGKFGPYILQSQAIPDPGNLGAICVAGATAGFGSGPAYLLANEYCHRVSLLDQKIKALNDYKNSLMSANNALTALQSNRTNLKGRALLNQLFNISIDLNTNISNVKNAFS